MTRPSYSTANLFMLFLLSYNILLALTISYLYWGMWHGTPVGEQIGSPWFLVINQVLGLLVPMFIFRAITGEYRHLKLFCQIKKKPLGIVNIMLIIALSLLLQPLMMLFSAIASLFLPNPVTGMISELAILPLPIALIIVALTPSICEEWVFRGFVQSKYEDQPIVVAAVVNGLFFGMIHMNLHQFSYAFVMGIVFAVIVYYTRSVLSGVLAHFVVNATQYTLGYWAATHHITPSYANGTFYDSDLWPAIIELGIFSLYLLPIVVGLFYIFIKHNLRRNPVKTVADPKKVKPRHPFDMAFWAVVLVYGLIVLSLM